MPWALRCTHGAEPCCKPPSCRAAPRGRRALVARITACIEARAHTLVPPKRTFAAVTQGQTPAHARAAPCRMCAVSRSRVRALRVATPKPLRCSHPPVLAATARVNKRVQPAAVSCVVVFCVSRVRKALSAVRNPAAGWPLLRTTGDQGLHSSVDLRGCAALLVAPSSPFFSATIQVAVLSLSDLPSGGLAVGGSATGMAPHMVQNKKSRGSNAGSSQSQSVVTTNIRLGRSRAACSGKRTARLVLSGPGRSMASTSMAKFGRAVAAWRPHRVFVLSTAAVDAAPTT